MGILRRIAIRLVCGAMSHGQFTADSGRFADPAKTFRREET